ncbi:melanocyte-stimulating hormone receptor-like [Acipenser oxyrinchus oxyrinchus]|uniref:Melanocyte-stimulating hormone receptor-like n=1 Tax=Acipenser oxyrinchus oxyrinchus TaxID=40147 RepID=A0AAD8DHD9_ACIOX|nr:melanocyte-stimulating hormone receptor-like [Acipenser oxyrinchus oxyrinchus]
MTLCSFTQLNASGLPMDHSSGNASSFSQDDQSVTVIEDWTQVLMYGGGKFFIIPAAVSLVAVLLASPLILLAIFSRNSLYEKAKFRLIANTLISDLIYCLVNLTVTATNTAQFLPPKLLCDFLLCLLLTTYFTGVLNVTAMVVDVFLAINWPLHYSSFLPTSRAVKLIVCIWVVSAMSSLVTYILLSTKDTLQCEIPVCVFDVSFFIKPFGPVLRELNYFLMVIVFASCFVLIVGCYCVMFWKTRRSGIWGGFSRARQTFFMHFLIFIFYFCPVITLITEKVLFAYKLMDFQSLIFVIMTVFNIVMILPKAITPYLYCFRCRELNKTIKSLIKWKVPISPKN